MNLLPNSITLPAGREPTEEEVEATIDFLDGTDWFSDYDCGISLFIDGEAQRVGPGQTILKHPDGRLEITGEEVPYYG